MTTESGTFKRSGRPAPGTYAASSWCGLAILGVAAVEAVVESLFGVGAQSAESRLLPAVDGADAAGQVRNGRAQAAFLLPAPNLDRLLAVAEEGDLCRQNRPGSSQSAGRTRHQRSECVRCGALKRPAHLRRPAARTENAVRLVAAAAALSGLGVATGVERVTAGAAGHRVRVMHREAAAHQRVHVVDLRPRDTSR